MVVLPEDTQQLHCSLRRLILTGVIWFSDTRQRMCMRRDVRATIPMSVSAAKRAVNVTVCKGPRVDAMETNRAGKHPGV